MIVHNAKYSEIFMEWNVNNAEMISGEVFRIVAFRILSGRNKTVQDALVSAYLSGREFVDKMKNTTVYDYISSLDQ